MAKPPLLVSLRRACLFMSSIVCITLLVGCTSQERLTAKATSCRTKDVEILSSDFARRGVTTAWCAECRGKVYQCASNAERTRVECRPSTPEDMCQ